MNGEHGGCGGLAGFAGGGCWFGGSGPGVGAIGANGHGEDSSPDAGGNRTRVREAGGLIQESDLDAGTNVLR